MTTRSSKGWSRITGLAFTAVDIVPSEGREMVRLGVVAASLIRASASTSPWPDRRLSYRVGGLVLPRRGDGTPCAIDQAVNTYYPVLDRRSITSRRDGHAGTEGRGGGTPGADPGSGVQSSAAKGTRESHREGRRRRCRAQPWPRPLPLQAEGPARARGA